VERVSNLVSDPGNQFPKCAEPSSSNELTFEAPTLVECRLELATSPTLPIGELSRDKSNDVIKDDLERLVNRVAGILVKPVHQMANVLHAVQKRVGKIRERNKEGSTESGSLPGLKRRHDDGKIIETAEDVVNPSWIGRRHVVEQADGQDRQKYGEDLSGCEEPWFG
jgi:hypothetical protein